MSYNPPIIQQNSKRDIISKNTQKTTELKNPRVVQSISKRPKGKNPRHNKNEENHEGEDNELKIQEKVEEKNKLANPEDKIIYPHNHIIRNSKKTNYITETRVIKPSIVKPNQIGIHGESKPKRNVRLYNDSNSN